MRAKFRCTSVKFTGDPENPATSRTYELNAVYDQRTAENERFAKATPFGTMTIQVDNPAASLQVGEEYYLDFIACAIAEAEVKPEAMGNTHDVAEGERYDPGTTTGYQAAHAGNVEASER
jgi:hypothetical protein